LLLGKFVQTIDADNRFTVPSPFQAELTGGAYMTQGFDRNLQVLTADAFKGIYLGATAFSIADPLARQLLRLFLGTAVRLAGEPLTTIAIPEDLKKFAGLEKDVVLVGQGDYIEIWAPGLWSTQETQLRDAEANSSRFAALQVATR
jgi:MraZ protein